MDTNDPTGVRQQIARRARQLLQETDLSEDTAARDEMELLILKSRISALAATADTRKPKKRWPVMLAVLLTLLVLSILFYKPVSETGIGLEARVSELGVTVPTRQALTSLTRLTSLGISGVATFTIPRSETGKPETIPASNQSGSAVFLETKTGQQESGTITLTSITLPAGTDLHLQKTGVKDTFRVTLKHPEVTLNIGLKGDVMIAANSPASMYSFPTPHAMVITPEEDKLVLEVAFSDSLPIELARQLTVSGLSMSRINQFLELDRSLVYNSSTLLEGTLNFEAFNSRSYSLYPGQLIRLVAPKGEIGALSLDRKDIGISFRGDVQDIVTGTNDERSLMPSVLEWLQAHHGLSLLWGSTLYVFGLLYGMYRWWSSQG